MNKKAFLFLALLTFIITGSLVTKKTVLVDNNVTSQSLVIYLDPGHGGFDGGASIDQLLEKDITLEISLYLKAYLEVSGYQVLMTRTTDQALATKKNQDIYKRVSLINNSSASLYLSIHANMYPNQAVFGAQVFYTKVSAKSRSLSLKIQEYLKQIDLKNQRQAKIITGKYLPDHVLIPGCIIEVGFLSNPEERLKLIDPRYQKQLAYAIYLGVIYYHESESL